MKHKIYIIVLTIIFSACVVSSSRRRVQHTHPSGFGRPAYGQQQDLGNFGQSQGFQSSNNQLEFSGTQRQEDDVDDDSGIQQRARDEDLPNFYGQRNQIGSTEPPPKYTQADSSELSLGSSGSQRQQQSIPEAVTPVGTFRGSKTTVNGIVVYEFYGIPYAKPPVGNLRFRKPELHDKLSEPYDASHLPNACPQNVPDIFNGFSGEVLWLPNTNISEDCLYLNMWVPASVFEKKESELVPVLYWIYGGGFFSGSNSLDVYNGKILAANQGIVVVSVQYRLGPHGFLYFGTDEAPGNMGLLDQSLGLRWTRENIEYFGGDPNTITVAGESCGAASTGFHLVSPLSKSYVKRGIMTSGLPNLPYSLKSPDEMKARSFQFAEFAGCKQKNVTEIVECLKQVDSDKLTGLQWKLYKQILDFPFSPTVDGYFLPDHPDNLIKNGKAKRADLILGTVQDEGTYFVLYHYLNYFSHLKPTSVPYDRFVDIMTELFHDYSDVEREAIINQYTSWENPEAGLVNQKRIGDAIGDAWFICPHRKFADEWSNRGLSVYYYHFTERFTTNPWAKWMGVMHGDDINLLFGAPLTDKSYTEGERNMSKAFMEMVGNFARKGIPSSKWERYTSEHPVYLDVNATIVSDSSTPDLHGPHAKDCAFWNKMLPLISRSEVEYALCQQQNRGFDQFPSAIGHKPQTPQWNPSGQGIHGGQGFQASKLPQPHGMPSAVQPSHCAQYPTQNTMYFPPQYFQQPPPGQHYSSHKCQDATPRPAESSCKCTVQEQSSSTQHGNNQQQSVTPIPL